MRVTNEMMVAASLRRLSTRLSSYEHRQAQLGTGKQVLKPSDDPAGTSRALALRASQRAREQELRNAVDAKSMLDATDKQLQAAVDRLQRVRDLNILGANATGGAERDALASEVTAIRDELASIANYRHGGRPLFGGFSDANPVAFDGAAAWTYEGDDGQSRRRVGEQDVVTVNVTAGDVFGFNAETADPSGLTKNLFRVLDDLAEALRAGDQVGITAAIDEVDAGRVRLTDTLGRVGTTANWVDSAVQRNESNLLTLRAELAEVEDVDLAEAIMELKTQEVAYQATLQALGRALPPSLVTFLS